MSDDEEIICKNNDLYNHLINHGFLDFESFIPPATKKEPFSSFERTQAPKTDNCSTYLPKKCIGLALSQHKRKQLELLCTSKLLFKEDVDAIETAIDNNYYIHESKSKWFWHISTVASLVCSIALSIKGVSFLPFGFTLGLTIYSFKNYFEERKEVEDCKKLGRHIDVLQSLCMDIQKLLRFAKETEILSAGIVRSQSAFYKPIPTKNVPIDELNIVSLREPQSHMRKCLLDSLTNVINILAFASDILKQNSLSTFPAPDDIDSFFEKRTINPKNDYEGCILLKELQALNDTYLCLQSEYLKLISFYLCPEQLNHFPLTNQISGIYTLCHWLDSKLNNISFQLKMQYALNTVFPATNRPVERFAKTDCNEVCRMQLEVHNVFVLLLSMLLRVRNVEEDLENIPSNVFIENQNEIQESIHKQFNTLKQDLDSTLKCFDHISQLCSKLIQNKVHDNDITLENPIEDITSPTNTIKTNVVLGTSDFTVNSPDEVFLAISGLCSDERELDSDDYFFEKKPQIPKNLLLELSDRLKTRKELFNEREKVALDREGLLDFPPLSDEKGGLKPVEEADEIDTYKVSKNPLEGMMVESDSSNSEDIPMKKRSSERIKQYRPRMDYSDSDSDCSVSNESERTSTIKLTDMAEINRFSLANTAALKSQLWRNKSEECYSDG